MLFVTIEVGGFMKNIRVGIDIGSTTVKVVVMNEKKEIKFSAYERHYSDTKSTIINFCTMFKVKLCLF